MPGTDLAKSLADTKVMVGGLLEEVEGLVRQVDVDHATLVRGKVAFIVGMVGLVLDLVLTVLVGWGLAGVDGNQDRINELQVDQTMQVDRNRTAQCAVNALLLQFEARTTTNPAYTEEQREEQRRVYETLRQINRDLGCR